MLEGFEGYRERFVGSQEHEDRFWGENQLNRPAYVRTANIIDTGILDRGSKQSPYYRFDCYTSIQMFNCFDKAIGSNMFGRSFGGQIYMIVSAMYKEARGIVYAVNPCPLSYIDVRTMEQYYEGCCPEVLGALMMA